jgi:putative membrane protein
MYFLLQLLLNGAILLMLARIMPSVHVRSYGTAIAVALVIGLLNATIGFLFRLPLNILTLGLLTFFVRLIVTAVVIRITDKLFSGFSVDSFSSALIIAVVMAAVGALFSR